MPSIGPPIRDEGPPIWRPRRDPDQRRRVPRIWSITGCHKPVLRKQLDVWDLLYDPHDRNLDVPDRYRSVPSLIGSSEW